MAPHRDPVRDAELLAERATLGALLTQPSALGEVSQWLRASDFTDPWHADLYTVLRDLHSAREPISPTRTAAGLTDRLGPRRANLPALADLLHVPPARPNAARYAQMVTETGLRHEVSGQGVLLRAAALRATLTGTGQPMTAGCNLVDATLATVARRWATATNTPAPADTTSTPLRAATRSTEVRLGADKLLRLHPLPDPCEAHDHEVALIAALIAHPDAIDDVARWLPPRRVSDPAWRTVYNTAVDLAELGEPVDAVTVSWALRRPAHHDAPVPPLPDLLGAVEAAQFTAPGLAARAVAGDQLRRLADGAANQLASAAGNPGVLVIDLVDTGHLLTGALRRVATALPATVSTQPGHLADVRELRASHGPVAG